MLLIHKAGRWLRDHLRLLLVLLAVLATVAAITLIWHIGFKLSLLLAAILWLVGIGSWAVVVRRRKARTVQQASVRPQVSTAVPVHEPNPDTAEFPVVASGMPERPPMYPPVQEEAEEPAMERPPSVEPSRFTRQSGVLRRDELKRVLYDEAHHWYVTFVMYFNPFWGEDHDVTPEMTEQVRQALSSRLNRIILRTMRIVVRIAQVIVALGTLAMLVWLATALFHVGMPLAWFGSRDSVLATVLLLVFQILWGVYIHRLGQRCRLVATDDKLFWIIAQMPWRESGVAVIDREKFEGIAVRQSVLGFLLRFTDFIIRTMEQEERLPAWIRARRAKQLRLVFQWWSYLSEMEAKKRKARPSLPGQVPAAG